MFYRVLKLDVQCICILNNNILAKDLPAITEIDLSRLAVFGLTLPSRCPCCPGGARKTQSLVAPTLELQIEKYIIYVSFVNLYLYRSTVEYIFIVQN